MAPRTKQRSLDDAPAPAAGEAPAAAHATPSPSASVPSGAPERPGTSNAERAYLEIEAEIDALPDGAATPRDLDVPAAVAVVLGALPAIRKHRDAIAEELPKHPVDKLDRLETYALGAWFANLVHVYASAGGTDSTALVDEASRLREDLLVAGKALGHRGLLDRDELAKVRGGSSPAEVAADVGLLARLFSAGWAKISGKTAVELREVERAAALGPMLEAVAGAKRLSDRPGYDAADRRLRAFALLEGAYDGARRALAYLRWTEGDADTLAPSIFRKKRGRKPKSAGANDLGALPDAADEGDEAAEAAE
jgi:hypothetical protein